MPPDDLLQRIRSAANGSASDAVNIFGQAGGAGKGILTTHPVSEGSVLVSVPGCRVSARPAGTGRPADPTAQACCLAGQA